MFGLYLNRTTRFVLSGICFLFSLTAISQDTLPKFSVRNIGHDHIIIDWINRYDSVKQINIQQSYDSLGPYKTILNVADPNNKENGFADTRAPNPRMFYRLFVVLNKGGYFFTTPKRPVFDTTRKSNGVVVNKATELAKDSIEKKNETVAVTKRPDFVPSVFVYTTRDGSLFVNLPDTHFKRYHIKFFEENGNFLFELKNIKERAITLDKTNFYHAGWFTFELYNDDKLIEKNKFYLNRMF